MKTMKTMETLVAGLGYLGLRLLSLDYNKIIYMFSNNNHKHSCFFSFHNQFTNVL